MCAVLSATRVGDAPRGSRGYVALCVRRGHVRSPVEVDARRLAPRSDAVYRLARRLRGSRVAGRPAGGVRGVGDGLVAVGDGLVSSARSAGEGRAHLVERGAVGVRVVQ